MYICMGGGGGGGGGGWTWDTHTKNCPLKAPPPPSVVGTYTFRQNRYLFISSV